MSQSCLASDWLVVGFDESYLKVRTTPSASAPAAASASSPPSAESETDFEETRTP